MVAYVGVKTAANSVAKVEFTSHLAVFNHAKVSREVGHVAPPLASISNTNLTFRYAETQATKCATQIYESFRYTRRHLKTNSS